MIKPGPQEQNVEQHTAPRESTSMNRSRPKRRRVGFGSGIVAGLLCMIMLAGCGDDGESAQDRYCAAGESIQTSLSSLTDLDLIAEGTDGLNTAVDNVKDDLDELRDAAGDAASDDVSALEQSVDDLEAAISALGGESVSTVATAIQEVASSAGAVLDTLADC